MTFDGNEPMESLEASFANRLLERLSRSAVAIEWLDVDGERSSWSGQELLSHAQQYAERLAEADVGPGDRVAVIAANSARSLALDVALLLSGCVTVPIHPEELSGHCARYLQATDPCLVIVGDRHQAARLLTLAPLSVPLVSLQSLDSDDAQVVVWTTEDAQSKEFQCAEITSSAIVISSMYPVDGVEPKQQSARLETPNNASDLAPPNSGDPGVPLQTADVVVRTTDRTALWHAATAFGDIAGLRAGQRLAVTTPSALPLTRTAIYGAWMADASVAVCSRVDGAAATIQHQLFRLEPHCVLAHPRLLEQLHTEWAERASRAGGFPERMYQTTLRVGSELSDQRQRSRRSELAAGIRFAMSRHFIGRRVVARLGGELQRVVLSSCIMAPHVARFYFGSGVRILESLGPAVAAGLSHLNSADTDVYGAGVTPLSGVETRISPTGEIELRGGHLPDKEQWHATGLIGLMSNERPVVTGAVAGCLTVLGNKVISADRLEARLVASPYVHQAVILGHGRDFLSALIVLNTDSVSRWLREHGVVHHSATEMSRHPLVYGLIEAVVGDINGTLPSYETVRKFAILERDLSKELGEVTSSMELRRVTIEARHRLIVESFYREQY